MDKNKAAVITLLYGLTIFLSAFLLFQIQPMISKFILPWFGGSSAVWTASMLFFQVLLLGGYAYAHALDRLDPRRQGRLHLLVLGAVLLWVVGAALLRGTPITLDPRWKPEGEGFPAGQVLWVLAVTVGIPYLLLATTSSLIQSWFRRVQQRSSPYGFYILSNAASLLALLTYPLLFEPAWNIHQQAVFWSVGFAAYLLFAALSALILLRSKREESAALMPEPDSTAPVEGEAFLARPGWKQALVWVSLAACASILLLAVTNHITQDVASVPFLWVLPLSLYLLSFMVAFNDRQVRLRGFYVLLTLVALYLGYYNLENVYSLSLVRRIVLEAALLFIISVLCHTELYARRPHPRYLTSFYLMVSAGGALGGIFVSLVVPVIFNDFWEYHLALVLSAGAAAVISYHSRPSWIGRLRLPVGMVAVALSVLIINTGLYWVRLSEEMQRNFYGVIRVRADKIDGMPSFRLIHGGIMHGNQVRTEPYRYHPTSYYTESSGVGRAIKLHPRRISLKPLRIGVVGLGVGTIAAYGVAGDVIRFYEINPQVVEMANDERYFSYLADSDAETAVVLGDARLSMERELETGGSQNYDVLAVDAFSGDSIPTHLLTREAIALYLQHLKPDGILALHISNRHIDLEPVTALLVDAFNLSAVIVSAGSSDWAGSYSVWVLITPDPDLLSSPAFAAVSEPLEKKPGLRIWTDDYTNLFQVIKN